MEERVSKDNDVFEEAMNRGGLKVFVADNHHLQLDLDKPKTPKEVVHQEGEIWQILAEMWELTEIHDTESQHGGVHRYIKLPDGLSEPVRIALQVILGSDPKRELLSLLRHVRAELGMSPGRPHVVLFETAAEAQGVEQFLGKPPLANPLELIAAEEVE